jgi:sulfoquinovose isomerase
MTPRFALPDEVAVNWRRSQGHRRWLGGEGDRLLSFYERSVADLDGGGFFWLDGSGRPEPREPKHLWINARMVHVFCLAHLNGRPGAATLADHGLRYLEHGLRDEEDGGWFSSVGPSGPTDATKQAYGHAFVLLAACSAVQAGARGGPRLLEEVATVVDERFWDEADGCCVDRWDRQWRHADPYRGQNANMHMTEAFLAAAEATGERHYLRRAERIAERLIQDITAGNDGRLPEHFDRSWRPELEYNRDHPDDLFRPYGSTVGHWFEWARLLAMLHATPVGQPWMLDSAKTMFALAVAEGWDADRGGILLSVDWRGQPLNEDRYHWPVAEAIGAASSLAAVTADPQYEGWYQVFWDYAATYLIDHRGGSWHHQLDPANRPSSTVWRGKPDLYHAYQATLAATTPPGVGFAAALRSPPDAVRPQTPPRTDPS